MITTNKTVTSIEGLLPTVKESQVFAYTLRRAISSPRLFNVVAVDKQGEPLVVVESDLEFDDAAEEVEKRNKSFV